MVDLDLENSNEIMFFLAFDGPDIMIETTRLEVYPWFLCNVWPTYNVWPTLSTVCTFPELSILFN